ncbi:MAG: hypothetical protein CL846_01820, partial [Crocinitomicaceae bacterium]|nr:hypothetical protein [Crocinitomicaceae bacterium]
SIIFSLSSVYSQVNYYGKNSTTFFIDENTDIHFRSNIISDSIITNKGNIYFYGDSLIGIQTSLFDDYSNASITPTANFIFSGENVQSVNSFNTYSPINTLLGSTPISFYNIEINNIALGDLDSIVVNQNLDVFGDFLFTNGSVSIDGENIFLRKNSKCNGILINETNDNRIFGFPGEVYVDRFFGTNTVENNIAGIGLGLTFDGNLATTRIARINDYVVNVSDGSIKRYYYLKPSNTGDVRSPKLFYFGDDLIKSPSSSILETDLNMYYSNDNGSNWKNKAGILDAGLKSVASTDSVFSLPTANNSMFTLAEKNCDSLTFLNIIEDTIPICSGSSAKIIPIGTTNIYSIWSTGEISDSIEVSSPGEYFVKIIDSRGCENEDSVEVITSLTPNANFTYSPNPGNCEGDVISFSYPNPDGLSGYDLFWDFDDPNGSLNSDTTSNLNPSYTYVYSGTFSPSMSITDANGCTNTSSQNLTVYPYPNASFSSADQCMGDAVSFINNSSISNGAILISEWNFNTNDPSSINVFNNDLSTVSFNYSDTGTYDVSLFVSSNGCSNTINQTVFIHPNPVSNFSISPNDTVCPNQIFNLINNTDTNVISNLSFDWDFGDLNTSSIFNPTYSYENSNSYTISLTSTSPFGCSDVSNKTIVVSDLPSPDFSFINSCEDSLIYFDNSLIDSSFSYLWNFDDGLTDSVMDPLHAFINYGSKNVQLIVANEFGCIDSITKQIEIYPNPIAFFPITRGCEGNDITFYGANSTISTGSISNYDWRYGDGNVGASSTSVHTYANSNTNSTVKYYATLTVTSSKNCTNSYSDSVTIYAAPDINLGGTFDTVLKPDSSLVLKTCGNSLTLSSNNPGCSFEWYKPLLFSTSTSVTVNADGMYFLKVTAPLSSSGCTSFDSVYVKLNSKITPDLGSSTSFCDSVSLSSGYPGSSNSWFLNDTLTTPLFSSSILDDLSVSSSGLYIVKVIDQNGCIGWDSLQVLINTSPNISLSDTTLCLGLPLSLDPQYVGPAGETYQWYLYGEYDIIPPPFSGIPTPSSLIKIGTSSTLPVDSTWQYFVEITDANGCIDTAESIVTFDPVPVVDFGVDTSYCDSVLLVDSNVGINYSYVWQDGSTNNSFLVNFLGTNTYSLEVSLGACSASDTIDLTINPSPVFDLGNDTILCSYQNLSFDLSSYGDVFDWNSGSSSPTNIISSTGNYVAEVGVSSTGCKTIDSINVLVNSVFQFDLGPDVFKCVGTDKLVSTGISSPGYTFNWSPNVSDTTSLNNINIFNSSSVYVDSNGIYYVQVIDPFGCEASDTINVLPTNLSLYARFLMPQSSSESDSIFYDRDELPLLNLSYPSPYVTLWEVSEQMANGSYLGVWQDTNAITLYNNGPYFTSPQPDSINRKIKLTVTNSVCSAEKTKIITVYKYINKDLDVDPSTKPFVLPPPNQIHANLYPNPTLSIINLAIELDFEADIEVFIYNTMGQLLISESIYTQKANREYDMYSYNDGVYIAVIKAGDIFKTIKFIKL